MLKLKYLFNNKNLAEMVLSNWEFDRNCDDLFEDFRISANAVYPFLMKDAIHFLRFTPEEETSKEKIFGELEFLKYLRDNGCPAIGTALSKKGNELELVDTPWGKYYAIVFRGAPGRRLDMITLTDEIIYSLGAELGNMHMLSTKYVKPGHKRISWKDQINWMKDVLIEFPEETAARSEVQILEEYLNSVPAEEENFGLVHYDFETDNIFYDAGSKIFTIIDFDDAVYHWFALDIEQSLDSIGEMIDPGTYEQLKDIFIRGYRSKKPVDDDMLNLFPVFRRYVDLFGYVRLLRSTKESWENEPDWMVDLRKHLSEAMIERRRRFGYEVFK